MCAIAFRMVESYLVVTNDGVVEIRDVEGTIWANGYIDWAKPRVVAGDEIRLSIRNQSGAVLNQLVPVYASSD